jgi:hypothetical protein
MPYNKHMAKIKTISVIGLIAITVLLIYWVMNVFSCRSYSCISLSFSKSWNEKEVYENTGKAYRALLTSSEGLVRIEKYAKLGLSDAQNLTNIRLMRMEGLFENARSPYPGPLSDEISCDTKYKPVSETFSVNTTDVTYINGYLNNRMQYGTCIDNQVVYQGYNALFYCKNHLSWYQIELIIPSDKTQPEEYYKNLFRSITCQSPLVNSGTIFP